MVETGSGQSLLSSLRSWYATNQAQEAGRVVRAVLSESPMGDSAFIELEADGKIGRATVWISGFCDLEVLQVDSGTQVFYEHHDAVDGLKLRTLLDGFLTRLRGH